MEGAIFRKRPMVFALTLFFLAAMGTSSALAIATVAGQSSEDPVIAANSNNGQYLIVYWDSDGEELLARRVSSNGTPLDGEIVIDSTVPDGQNEISAVAYNPKNDVYLVVWEDGGVIKARNVNGSTGDMIGSTKIISAGISSNYRPDVAYNSNDNTYLVVWLNKTDPPKFQGRLVPANFAFLGSVQTYGDADGGETGEEAAVAYNSINNGFLVVFETEKPGQPDIQARYANNIGFPQGSAFVVDSASSDSAADPGVAYSPDNNRYFVVWEDDQDPPGGPDHILLRMVAASGGPIGSNTDVTPKEPGSESREDPHLAVNPAGGYLMVVFENNDKYRIEGRCVFTSGIFESNIFSISPNPDLANPAHKRDDPKVAFNPHRGSFLVTFENTDSGSGVKFIEAKKAGCSGPVIPTLDQWGMLIFSVLLLFGGLYHLRRYREV